MSLYPEAPPGSTPNARRSRPTDARCSSPTRTTTRWRSSTSPSAAGAAVEGFVPTGWYPTGVAFDARRHADLRALRQGSHLAGESARARSPADTGDRPVHRGAAHGLALGHSRRPTPQTLAEYTRHGLSRSRRTATRRALAPAGAPKDSPIPRRVGAPVADPARLLRHPREPHLRSDPRRRGARATATRICASSARTVTPNAHALARRVRALRQLLRRRRGQLRRPRLLDGGVRDRRDREALAAVLRPQRGASTYPRAAARMRNAVRQPHRAGGGLHLGRVPARRRLRPQLRRVRRSATKETDERPGRRAAVRGLGARLSRARLPGLSALRPLDPGRAARRRLAAGVPRLRGERRAAAALSILRLGNDHTAGTRRRVSRRRAP